MGIDWTKTKELLGDVGPLRFNPYVIKVCQGCSIAEKRRYKGFGKPSDPYYCTKCVANRPDKRIASSEGAKKGWESQEYRDKIVENSKSIWNDKERAERMTAHDRDPEFIARLVQRNKELPNDPEWREAVSESRKKLWEDPAYRAKLLKILSDRAMRQWADPDYRKFISLRCLIKWKETEYRESITAASLNNWQNNDYREKMLGIMNSAEYKSKISESMKLVWRDDSYKEQREKIINNLRSLFKAMPRVSSLQTILYSILDDLGVKYYREHPDKTSDEQCLIGPYSFDCVVPRENKPTLLIECQGDYWHSLKCNITRDRAKASYISNNFPGKYEIKYIWEHEFSAKDRVTSLLRYWLGVQQPDTIDFEFNDVTIKECPSSDYRLLLSKYHYLANAGRGGITTGAYIGEKLVAVCVFSPLVRQNIPFDKDTTRELSRLCIHPSYQKKNFASWFVSKCIKQLDPKYTKIISYCDTSYNHDGAIYKACNFKLNGEIKPDYWYIDENGWVMHKKSLYNNAVKMKMTEKEYATKWGYKKIYGMKKLRFILTR